MACNEGRVGSSPSNPKTTSADIADCTPMAEGVVLVERKAKASKYSTGRSSTARRTNSP
jgi:hypothetical protein